MLPSLSLAEAPAQDSLATRIAARRQDSARRRWANAPSSAASAQTKKNVSWAPGSSLVAISRLAPVAAPLTESQELNRTAGHGAAPSMTPTKHATATGGGRAASMYSPPPPPNKPTASKEKREKEALAVLADMLMDKAERADASANEIAAPREFSARLGQCLHSRSTDVKALVAEWDRSGEGVLRKMEFRLCIKKLGLVVDTTAIDALFKELDTSRAGALTLKEIKSALKTLLEQAGAAATRMAASRQAASRLRQRAEQVQMAAQALETAETAERKLAAMREMPPLAARLGALLLRRNAKVEELTSKLDPKGSGRACKKEFVAGMRAIGLAASSDECDELFDSFAADAASSGGVGLPELRQALKRLQDEAAHVDADALAQAKTCALLRKSCRMQQAALRKALAEDEAAGLIEAVNDAEAAPTGGAEANEELEQNQKPAMMRAPTARRIF